MPKREARVLLDKGPLGGEGGGLPYCYFCLPLFWAFQFQEDVVRLLGEEMKKSENANGFVIDGFPANLNQGMIIILISGHIRNASCQIQQTKWQYPNISETQKVKKYLFYSQAF